MDRREARLILQACRPGGQDRDHPAFAEALALVEHDPELKEWWEAQQSFDRQVFARLQAVPVPPHLQASILAGRKVEQLSRRRRLPYWLAAAALILVLMVTGWSQNYFRGDTTTALRYADFSSSVLDIAKKGPVLALESNDPHKISSWLESKGNPAPRHLSAALASVTPIGCQEYKIHGVTVSLVCFQVGNGGVVHFFVVDQRALSASPGATPIFERRGMWTTAGWSDGKKTYFTVSLAGEDALKRLL